MKARSKLKQQATASKEMLSNPGCYIASIYVEVLLEDGVFEYELDKNTFETICQPLFDRMIQPLDEAFAASNMEKTDIDRIVLVGGTTRIPAVRDKLTEYFNGKDLSYAGSPDEDVAKGAAILGGMIAQGEHLNFEDVTSFAFGIEAVDPSAGSSILDVIIPRN